MKKFDYKEVGKEIGWNFSTINYTIEHLSDFDYYKEVVKHITPTTKILDLGCGGAEKSSRFYSLAERIYLTDIETEMLKKAKENIDKYYEDSPTIKNKFKLGILDCNGPFNFLSSSLDMVVSRHCEANIHEVFRVLKNGGVFVSEDYDTNDCQELKDMFERGQGYNEAPLYISTMKECLEKNFSNIELIRFQEIEYYKSIDDLNFLLTHTPILEYYDESQDEKTLQAYIEKYSTKKGIRLTRRLFAFVIKK